MVKNSNCIYAEVIVWNNSIEKLSKSLIFERRFIKGFYIFGILFIPFVLGVLAGLSNWDFSILILTIITTLVFVFAIVVPAINQGAFSHQKLEGVEFDIESIEYTDKGQMFVDAYIISDVEKKEKYRFKFNKSLNLDKDFFFLTRQSIKNYSRYYYCERSI